MADIAHTSAPPLVSYNFCADPDCDLDYFLDHPERIYRIRDVRRSEGKNLPHKEALWYIIVRYVKGTSSAIFFSSSLVYSYDPREEPDDAECDRVWNKLSTAVDPGWLADLEAAEWVTHSYHAHGPIGTAYIHIGPVPDKPGTMKMESIGPLMPRTTVSGTLKALLARAEGEITNGDPDMDGAALRVMLPPAVAWK